MNYAPLEQEVSLIVQLLPLLLRHHSCMLFFTCVWLFLVRQLVGKQIFPRKKKIAATENACLFAVPVRSILHRIIENLKLEGSHKDHQVHIPAPHRTT